MNEKSTINFRDDNYGYRSLKKGKGLRAMILYWTIEESQLLLM